VKALVIGYGSIGARHARVLSQGLLCHTAVLSNREVDFPLSYHSLEEALDKHAPDYVVVANQTNLHHEMLSRLALAGFAGRVLIEKPIFEINRPMPVAAFKHVAVAYNLRFHPLIRRLKEIVAGLSVLSVNAYVGQYLPNWRPTADYRKSYSANRNEGGGVLKDLSHEIDYLTWLFGDWKSMATLGGHFSKLEIESDDLFVLLANTSRCAAMTVQMSYLDRSAIRRVIVNTTDHTIEINLIDGNICINGKVEKIPVEHDFSYLSMHQTYLYGDSGELCSVEEGLDVLKLIDRAELANRTSTWVSI
jgi:predicted dehydrogenase